MFTHVSIRIFRNYTVCWFFKIIFAKDRHYVRWKDKRKKLYVFSNEEKWLDQFLKQLLINKINEPVRLNPIKLNLHYPNV